MKKNLIALIMLFCMPVLLIYLKGQETKFTFTSTLNGYHIKTDSILVYNISQPDTIVLRYPDSVLSWGTSILTSIDESTISNSIIKKAYPNPFFETTHITINVSTKGKTNIFAYNTAGKLIAKYSEELPVGSHSFKFCGNEKGMYILNIQTPDGTDNVKVIQAGKTNNLAELNYSGQKMVSAGSSLKSSSDSDLDYEPGDSLKFIGYLTNGRIYHKTIIDNPTTSTDFTFDTSWYYWNDAQGGLEAMYLTLYFDGAYRRMYPAFMDVRSDEFVGESADPLYPAVGQFIVPSYYYGVYRPWCDFYLGILRANEILEYYPKMEMDDDLRNRMMGEAYFIRGLCYYHLLNLYREVPLYTSLAKANSEYQIEKSSRSEGWNQVISDLQTAMPLLPEKGSYAESDSINATRGAAKAFLAKSYIYTEQWEKAANTLKEIIDYGNYALVSDYKDNCNRAGEHNAESIFELMCSYDYRGTSTSWVPAYGNEENYSFTSSRLFTFYPEEFGGWDDVEVNNWLHEAFLQDSTIGDDKQRDPRMDASYYHTGNFKDYFSSYKYEDVTEDSLFPHKFISDGLTNATKDGYNHDVNIRIMRYSEVLLLYAEALYELGQSSEAIPYINQVRNRAGLSEYSSGLSSDEVFEAIVNERLLELSGECVRYADIVRWGWLSDSDKLDELKSRDSEFNNYQSGREYLPIPSQAMEDNPNLTQDSGWE